MLYGGASYAATTYGSHLLYVPVPPPPVPIIILPVGYIAMRSRLQDLVEPMLDVSNINMRSMEQSGVLSMDDVRVL